jgi:integrase
MPTKNLTVRFLDSIKAPASGRIEYWDTGTSGFGLRVSDQGRKTWVVLYRHHGRLRRLTLGTYPALSLADAREEAEDARRAAAKGRDPAGEKRAIKLGDTFEDLATDYIELHAKVNKRSWRDDQRAINRDLLPRFRHMKIADVKRRDVIAMMDAINSRGAPIMANRTLEIIRRIYSWAIEKDRAEHNPCIGVKPFAESSRDRVLSDDEIRALWKALDAQTAQVAGRFRLQLLTAQRPGEIRKMRWQDIDLAAGWWTIPAELAKNGLSHRVPLSCPALAILQSVHKTTGDRPWVFPSPLTKGPVASNVKATAALCKSIGASFSPHDLRRTAASNMGSMGISRFSIGRVLNHVDGTVTAVYDRHTYDQEKRQALDAWARRIGEIISGKKTDDGKVVQLRPEAG